MGGHPRPRRYNAALEYYKLDGWVTEHVTTLLEVSNLYRWVCMWVCACGGKPQGPAHAKQCCTAYMLLFHKSWWWLVSQTKGAAQLCTNCGLATWPARP